MAETTEEPIKRHERWLQEQEDAFTRHGLWLEQHDARFDRAEDRADRAEARLDRMERFFDRGLRRLGALEEQARRVGEMLERYLGHRGGNGRESWFTTAQLQLLL